MTKKIIYFTANAKPTTEEQADIDALLALVPAPFQVVVRDGHQNLSYGAGVESADYLAGTVPASYIDEEEDPIYPVIDDVAEPPRPDNLPANAAVVYDTADLGAVTTGTFTDTATVTVEDGEITAIELS